ncbi:MAG: hypothetical protein KTR32_04410 [Granulosicoccus sp.]|nr:hypothetical protein [Granulosicoccus sp.]
MRELDLFDEESGTTVFRDIIMLALAGFVTLVMLLLPHIHPEAVAEDTDQAPGNMIIELRWPDELNADVDLWVQAPGDKPVGYLHKGGRVFDLLRDDLGKGSDLTGLNYEFAYSRGAPAGEYIINVHLYRNKDNVFPVPATVAVSLKSPGSRAARQILASNISLNRAGQETTVFRFKLDEKSKFLANSVHDLPKPLRSTL